MIVGAVSGSDNCYILLWIREAGKLLAKTDWATAIHCEANQKHSKTAVNSSVLLAGAKLTKSP